MAFKVDYKKIYKNHFINDGWLNKDENKKFDDFFLIYADNKLDTTIENSIFIKKIKSEYLKWERKQKIEKINKNED